MAADPSNIISCVSRNSSVSVAWPLTRAVVLVVLAPCAFSSASLLCVFVCKILCHLRLSSPLFSLLPITITITIVTASTITIVTASTTGTTSTTTTPTSTANTKYFYILKLKCEYYCKYSHYHCEYYYCQYYF